MLCVCCGWAALRLILCGFFYYPAILTTSPHYSVSVVCLIVASLQKPLHQIYRCYKLVQMFFTHTHTQTLYIYGLNRTESLNKLRVCENWVKRKLTPKLIHKSRLNEDTKVIRVHQSYLKWVIWIELQVLNKIQSFIWNIQGLIYTTCICTDLI